MKTIKLLFIKKESDTGVNLDYRAQIAHILQAPLGGQGGVSVADMRSAIQILDKLDGLPKVKEQVLTLEDAQWEFLVERVRQFPWPMAHKTFLAFVDAIEKAPDVK